MFDDGNLMEIGLASYFGEFFCVFVWGVKLCFEQKNMVTEIDSGVEILINFTNFF